MPDDRYSAPAEPDRPQAEPPPDSMGPADRTDTTRVFMVAAGVVLASGLVLFGWDTLRILFFSAASALLSDWAARAALHRREQGARRRAVLVGMLTACTLPPTVHWLVPVVASASAALAGVAFTRGQGRRLWHPVALGRVAVQIVFHEQLSPACWPVLASGFLLSGDLSAARPLPSPAAWTTQAPDFGTQAWEVHRPADALAAAVPAHAGAPPAAAIAALVRDTLPPWSDTLTGVAGGAIGEACGWAILAAGLLLMWPGPARWIVPLTGVLTAALLAATLPVTIHPGNGAPILHWLPGLDLHDGLPVGLLYVLYHLTAGEFLLVLMLLAADPASSPLAPRGQAVFGVLVGGLSVALRVLIGVPAAGYWALLIANTLVPLVNRVTFRGVPAAGYASPPRDGR